MKKSIIFFFALIYAFSVSAQIQWQKSLGGTGYEGANSIIQTSDNGYVVVGYSTSNDGDVTGNHGSYDLWVVKLNSSGAIEWQQSFGGTGHDVAFSVIQTYNNGYIVAGNARYMSGNHGGNDYYILKLDSSGNIQWEKSLGGTLDDYGTSIIQTFDSGYTVTGYSESDDGNVTGNHGDFDYWVVKLNSSGNIQWQKSLGGTGDDEASSIIQTFDSGYVVAGYSRSNSGDVTGNHGNFDYWVVKLNTSGNIQWQKSFGGTDDDEAYSLIQTYDSVYLVAGWSQSNNGDVTGNHGGQDSWIVKLDTSGNIQWQKCLGGTGYEDAYSIIQNYSSGYTVGASSSSNDGDVTGNHGGIDYWVVKLDTSGTIEWQKSLGGTDSEQSFHIVQTSDNGYAVAGYSNSNDGDVTGNHGLSDYWVVKLGAATGLENIFGSNALDVYPNPSTNSFSIPSNSEFDNAQLNIFNSIGGIVYSSRLNRQTKVIYAENFSSGIYYLQIIKGEKMWGEKIIKQ